MSARGPRSFPSRSGAVPPPVSCACAPGCGLSSAEAATPVEGPSEPAASLAVLWADVRSLFARSAHRHTSRGRKTDPLAARVSGVQGPQRTASDEWSFTRALRRKQELVDPLARNLRRPRRCARSSRESRGCAGLLGVGPISSPSPPTGPRSQSSSRGSSAGSAPGHVRFRRGWEPSARPGPITEMVALVLRRTDAHLTS